MTSTPADEPPADEPAADGAPRAAPRPPSRAPSRRKARERSAMLLRLDPAVHDALTRWAADELRSTNAHVEWLLRKALKDAGRPTG